MSSIPERVEAKAYTKKEIAAMYGISSRALTTWLKPFLSTIGTKQGKYYNVNQVREIFTKLGTPGTMIV